MFALLVKVANVVMPHKRVAEPWPKPEEFEPMPTCMEEYHAWRWKV